MKTAYLLMNIKEILVTFKSSHRHTYVSDITHLLTIREWEDDRTERCNEAEPEWRVCEWILLIDKGLCEVEMSIYVMNF